MLEEAPRKRSQAEPCSHIIAAKNPQCMRLRADLYPLLQQLREPSLAELVPPARTGGISHKVTPRSIKKPGNIDVL